MFFGEIATLGTIPDRLQLPVLPGLGALAIGDPLYELVKPGQPAPHV